MSELKFALNVREKQNRRKRASSSHTPSWSKTHSTLFDLGLSLFECFSLFFCFAIIWLVWLDDFACGCDLAVLKSWTIPYWVIFSRYFWKTTSFFNFYSKSLRNLEKHLPTSKTMSPTGYKRSTQTQRKSQALAVCPPVCLLIPKDTCILGGNVFFRCVAFPSEEKKLTCEGNKDRMENGCQAKKGKSLSYVFFSLLGRT